MLTVLSFGGGQDSTALLYRYAYDPEFRARYAPDDFVVVMADTNDEHPATLAHVRSVAEWCVERGIEFHWLHADQGWHSTLWSGLREFYAAKNAIGSKAYPKTCTDNLKVQPIYRWLESWLGERYGVKVGRKRGFLEYAERYGRLRMLIGIAAGEEKRIASAAESEPVWRRASVERVYPLVELGMDRAACQAYIRSVGHIVPPPSNCMLCPFMSLIELLWLYRHYPDDYHEWVRLEAAKIAANTDKGEKNLGVWGKRLLPEALQLAIQKHGHMTDEQLADYKMSHGHCVASRY